MPDEPPASTPINPFWKAVVVSGFLFVGTALAILTTPLGDQLSPGNIFMRKHGALLAAIEVGAVLVTGVLAMALDQRQSRKVQRSSQHPAKPQQTSTEESIDVG